MTVFGKNQRYKNDPRIIFVIRKLSSHRSYIFQTHKLELLQMLIICSYWSRVAFILHRFCSQDSSHRSNTNNEENRYTKKGKKNKINSNTTKCLTGFYLVTELKCECQIERATEENKEKLKSTVKCNYKDFDFSLLQRKENRFQSAHDH